ncbi:hypothetical protein D3C85_1774260 [compost metagenome]
MEVHPVVGVVWYGGFWQVLCGPVEQFIQAVLGTADQFCGEGGVQPDRLAELVSGIAGLDDAMGEIDKLGGA